MNLHIPYIIVIGSDQSLEVFPLRREALERLLAATNIGLEGEWIEEEGDLNREKDTSLSHGFTPTCDTNSSKSGHSEDALQRCIRIYHLNLWCNVSI